MELYSFIKILLRHTKILVLTPLFAGVTIFFLTGKAPRTYVSSALIHTGLAAGKQGNVQSGVKRDYFRVQASFDNMIHLISSDKLLARALFSVIDTISKDSLSEEFSLLLESLIPFEGAVTVDMLLTDSCYISGELTPYLQSETNLFSVVNIKKQLRTSRVGTSDLLKISYTGRTARLSQLTLSTVVNLFLDDYKLLKNREVNSSVEFFKEQMRLAFNKLESAEIRLKKFREESKIINYYEQTKYMADQVIKLELEQNRIRMDRSRASAEIKKISNTIGSEKISAEIQRVLSSEAQLLIKRERVEDGKVDSILNGVYRKKIEKSDTDQAEEPLSEAVYTHWKENFTTVEGNRTGLINKWFRAQLIYEGSIAKEKTIARELIRLRKYVYSFAPLGSELNRLEREAKVREEEYLEMQHNFSVAILTQRDLQLSSVISIIDSASFPVNPEASKRLVTTLLGAVVSFSLALGVVLLIHSLDHSIATPSRLEELTGYPVVLVLPDIHNFSHTLFDTILERSLDRFHSKIKPVLEGITAHSILVTGWSIGNGKSFAANLITEQFRTFNSETDLVTLQPLSCPAPCGNRASVFDTPSLVEQPLVLEACGMVDFILPVFSAREVFTPAMKQMLKDMSKRGEVVGVILSNCGEEGMVDAGGELPKKRSMLRKWIKRTVSGEQVE